MALSDRVPLAPLADTLVSALERHGTATSLRSSAAPDPSAYGALLDRCERSHDQVVLAVGNPVVEDAWAHFALRQADRVMALVDASEPPPAWTAEHPSLRGCDVLFAGRRPEPAAMGPWLDALNPVRQHVVGAEGEAAAGLQRVARRLTGRSVGLVLSGGGARGLAHIGVVQALADAEIEIDRVGACGTGAFVAGLLATGRNPTEMVDLCREELVRRNPFNDYTPPQVSITEGRKVIEMLERVFGERTIEELGRELYCVSADLASAEVVVERRGPLAAAVARSMALPGLVPPAASDGRLLVDGGVLDNLPVGPMVDAREGPVIAVDVVGRRELVAGGGSRRWAPPLRTGEGDPERELPSVVEIIARATVLGSLRTAEAARARADVVVLPDVADTRLVDFDALDELVDAGARAAVEALEGAQVRLAATERP